MDLLKKSIFLLGLISVLSGCAQVGYLYEQGMGQWSLLRNAKENQVILTENELSVENKEKIRNIEKLKKYFYEYWEKQETQIYSKTTILKQEAVTYLVVVAPFDEIKPVETCFPFMGCFPYLGFFSEKSAKEYAQKNEAENKVAWIRPVYAYSTLGYFTDTILSSFFYYNDYELAELVFHELFHTIFFVKNEVDLNENLAMHFSDEMLLSYFESIGKRDYYLREKALSVKNHNIIQEVLKLAGQLDQDYKLLTPKNKNEAKSIFDYFMNQKFIPKVEELCQKEGVSSEDCKASKSDWNNAKFAAFMTYEKNSHIIEETQKKLGLELKDYYTWINDRYNEYQKQKISGKFEDFLYPKE